MSSWPIFQKDKILIGNEKSPLAICTLWSRKEDFLELSKDEYSIIGNLYTNDGINYLVKNILANPRIRCIIVCGLDLSGAGKALINFFKYGIDKNYKIVNSEAFIDSSIPKEKIEILRKNVEVVDLRNEEKVLEKVKEISRRLPKEVDFFTEPIVLGERKEVSKSLTSQDVVFRIEGKTLAETWLKILDVVLKFGEVKESEYGIKQKEVLDVVAVVKNVGEIPEYFPVSQKTLEEYSRQFFTKEKPKGVDYTYGERLFGLELNLPSNVKEYIQPQILKEAKIILNQVDLIIKKLKSKKFTRRAIAVTWRHEIDTTSENPPCLVEIVWSVKNDKLYQTCTFRSHDIWGAWLFNAFALRNLQNEIARELKIEVGNLIILSVSAHIYENNWEQAENLVEKYQRNKLVEFENDPRGYFLIRIENGEIVVEHRLFDGRKSGCEFRGKSAEEIYKKIVNENLISKFEHAAYLGKELAKAEIALKEGKEYLQE
jgi:thymidylate synthase